MKNGKKNKNKKNGKKNNNGGRDGIREKIKWHEDLKKETKHSILAVVCFALSLVFILTAFNKAGVTGGFIYRVFEAVFGAGFFLIPVLFFILGVSFLISFKTRILAVNLVGAGLFLTSALGIIESVFKDKSGGYFGYFVSLPLLKFFDIWVTFIILFSLFIVSVLMIFNISLHFKPKEKGGAESGEPQTVNVFNKEGGETDLSAVSGAPDASAAAMSLNQKKDFQNTETEDASGFSLFTPHLLFKKDEGFRKNGKIKEDGGLPPVSLLHGDKGKPSFGDIKANSNIIKRTLQNFGIEVEMGEVSIGPSVTQFTLKPAQGVKLTKITALSNDLSLALAAHPLRIEAPIPGRSLVGIEVPNKLTSLVGLRSLIDSPEFSENKADLTLSLGRNVAGQAVYADLAKMPHLLIAGSTGSGKSVCIHSLITSLLYKNSAKNLRFLMIDPKRVELNAYSNIPHLLAPAITDAKKTIMALKWAAKEMERRYEVLFNTKVRDINSYREFLAKKGEENDMPYIVIIIDELADIMVVYPRELEASIVRLAQMSRAVGIHLIVSTQRPSVEVITGLIKANITSRVAFQVASQIDSRTILDMSGAEKLLGNGDMLFLAGDSSKPRRIQGAFVSEEEVKRVTAYLEQEALPELNPPEFDLNEKAAPKENFISPAAAGFDFDIEKFEEENSEEDDLYPDAKKVVLEAGKASASYLQRRLKVGYARAARLLDILEKNGVVGPGDGAKPRDVYRATDV